MLENRLLPVELTTRSGWFAPEQPEKRQVRITPASEAEDMNEIEGRERGIVIFLLDP